MTVKAPSVHRGDDRLLFGIILGVLAFWLFAQTTLNIAPAMAATLNVGTNVINIAVSITALFSGIFIVVNGGLADRLGRVKILMWGFAFSIAGSLFVGFAPSGALAAPVLMLGRICQGLSGAFIMPASLALIKTYWEGSARQRAISLWSMGSWGGSGFAALFGGLMAENGSNASKAPAGSDVRFARIYRMTSRPSRKASASSRLRGLAKAGSRRAEITSARGREELMPLPADRGDQLVE